MNDLESIFAAFDENDPYGAGALLTPEARLSDAIEEGNYPRAYAILRKLDRPLEGYRAADCLIHSFSRTPKLFYAVLEHLSPEVRCGSMGTRSLADGSDMFVSGTLLVLAAALGMAMHVEALLARGFDVNAASPESAVSYGRHAVLPYGPRFRRCAAPGNSITVTGPEGQSVTVNGCTPLAAAIAAGNVFTYDALLAVPGVWKTESSAVCRAAALHAEHRDFERFWVMRWTAPASVCRPEETDRFLPFDLRDALFPHVRMQPASFADFCSPALLRTQYASGQCTDEDARAVLTVLRQCPDALDSDGCDDALTDKLLLTAERFPAVCREPEMRDIFLRIYVNSLLGKPAPKPALLQCWKTLCGPERDVSACGLLIFCLRGEALKRCLAELAEGGSLYASADALRPDSLAELREMLRWIRVVPSPFRTGLSSFAKAVLSLSPDARLMKKLYRDGPLSFEPREALLRAADVRLRPLILTSSAAAPAEPYDPLRTGAGFSHFCCLPEGACASRADAALSGSADEAECLLCLSDPDILSDRRDRHICYPGFPEMRTLQLRESIHCAENPAALRAWLRLNPEAVGEALQADLIAADGMRSFIGPPLALAAAAGRTENVRTLLALDPQPDPCCHALLESGALPCTPFLLALWFGREETARALLAFGAVCDLSRDSAYRLFRAMPPHSRALAARLSGVGYDRAVAREAREAAGRNNKYLY